MAISWNTHCEHDSVVSEHNFIKVARPGRRHRLQSWSAACWWLECRTVEGPKWRLRSSGGSHWLASTVFELGGARYLHLAHLWKGITQNAGDTPPYTQWGATFCATRTKWGGERFPQRRDLWRGGIFMKCYSKHLIFQLCEESISWQTSSQDVCSEWRGHPGPACGSHRVLHFLGHKKVLLTDG